MSDLNRYYAILGVAPGTSYEDIRKAYRQLVKAWHPDLLLHNPELQRIAHHKLSNINLAYESLRSHLASDAFSEERSKVDPAPAVEANRAAGGHTGQRGNGRCDPDATRGQRPWNPQDRHEKEDFKETDADRAGFSDSRKPSAAAEGFVPEVIWRYHQAAEQGFDNAQFELGLLYYHGRGVPQDYVEAYKWLWLAVAAQGRVYLKADHYLSRLRACLTREQIAEATRRLAPFTYRHSGRPQSNRWEAGKN